MDVSRRAAAVAGAAHAVGGAGILLSSVAAARAAGVRHWSLEGVEMLFPSPSGKAFEVAAAYAILASLVASTLVGLALGVLARRLTASIARRIVVLAISTVPALYLIVAVALVLIFAPQVARQGARELAEVPGVVLIWSVFGTVMVLPAALLPAVASVLMLEGRTRPSALGQRGLANPAVRRRILQLLLAVTAALLTFAYSR
jgi:F0F1-type ATP synthase assembly protein I